MTITCVKGGEYGPRKTRTAASTAAASLSVRFFHSSNSLLFAEGPADFAGDAPGGPPNVDAGTGRVPPLPDRCKTSPAGASATATAAAGGAARSSGAALWSGSNDTPSVREAACMQEHAEHGGRRTAHATAVVGGVVRPGWAAWCRLRRQGLPESTPVGS